MASQRHAILDLGMRRGTRTIKGVLYPAGPGRQTEYVLVCDCGSVIFANKCRALQNRTCNACDLKQRVRNKPSPRRLDPSKAAFNELFNAYRGNARLRKLNFELSREQFVALTQSDCGYCGAPPSGSRRTKTAKGTGHFDTYTYNGIDRVDSRQGYVPDNVIAACKTCNFMKRSMSVADFYAHIERILAHRPK